MYDVIVVGSGPGGSSTACIFAEAGLSVLLVEEGQEIKQEEHKPFSLSEMDYKYRSQGATVALGNPKINYIEGKVVGGGSEVNSGLYYPPNKKIISSWIRNYDIRDFSFNELEKHSAIIEKDISVSFLPIEAPLASKKLAIGAQNMNWSSEEVPRWFKYETKTPFSGIRQSMSETYIPKFLKAGGKLITDRKALKLRKVNEGWEITLLSNGSKETLTAKSIFLACGAIQTPLLLRRSGFRKNIGNSLRMHPTIKVIAKFQETLNYDDLGVPVHQVKEFAPEYSFGCAISSKEFIATGLIDYPEQLNKIDEEWKHMISYYAMSCGGNGFIRNLPFNLGDFVKYSIRKKELRVLTKALKDLCKLLFASGAVELYPSIADIEPLKSLEDINKLPNILNRNTTSLMTIHLMSGCPMGENLKKCAVDSNGKLHGTEGLYISDSSILCSAIGYNPQGTTMAIVRRNAFNFLKKKNYV